MKNVLGGEKKENLVALGVGAVGFVLLVFAIWREPVFYLPDLLLALVLSASIALANCYPIHIRYATKVTMISVPLFLCAALLPGSLAMLSGGAGMLLAAWLTRKQRNLIPIDFITDPARWVIILFVTSTLISLVPVSHFWSALIMLPAAVVMFGADILTFSIFTSLVTSEPILILVKYNLVQVFAFESIQYIIGILGSIAYVQAFWALLLLLAPIIISYRIFKNLKEMDRGTRAMLINMADTIDMRDLYTGGHSRRVAEYAVMILRAMNISGTEADLIETGARLHDIGKLAIPDAVLLKPGDFTPEEWLIMQSHAEKSSVLLSRYPDFKRGAEIVLSHHERWDGKGYPHGLKEYEIPLGARIIAVADAFDAMITDRPYRPTKTIEKAISILREGSGSQWDAKVVSAFIGAITANPASVPVKSKDLPL